MAMLPVDESLEHDVRMLGRMLGTAIRSREGEDALALIEDLRRSAIALRKGELAGGRDAFSQKIAALYRDHGLDALERVAHAFTQYFHLINAAEEQQRIRVLRRRDLREQPPEGSIAAAGPALLAASVGPDEVRALLQRLFIMPVLTAHPTEARRRTVLDHLAFVSHALDALDDPRPGARERARTLAQLEEIIVALFETEEARTVRPTPLDEVRAGLHVFERTLLEVTPAIYRSLEEMLAETFPKERFEVGSFLRWGTWIGGDRDGNPHVTHEVTRAALERQRALAIRTHVDEVEALGRLFSLSRLRVDPGPELTRSLAEDRARLPEVAARARRYEREPFREKLAYMRARLEAARVRAEWGYADARSYLEELRLLERSLERPGLELLAHGRLRDARRRAEVFGFHLASLDLRQHSKVHEAAVDELLARAGSPGYAALPENERVARLAGLLGRADLGAPRDLRGLSPETRELLATLEVVGRARRDAGPEACERYVVSFTSAVSDLLEVQLLGRAAHLAPDELKPVPLLEQLEDLGRSGEIAERMLELPPLAAALHGELEVMIGYSDSGKQVGYVASAVALERAQESLARVVEHKGALLTIFHGRGGAIGRGGGPSSRSILAQPARALAGRLRVTEQGETITARYGRPEIARRDLEQMVQAVVLASLGEAAGRAKTETGERRSATGDRRWTELGETLGRASLVAYEKLIGDRERLAAYAVEATPIEEIAELPIASRPSSRRAGLSFEDLRAIPWVFSWAQSRHGVPGWFGLGSALEAAIAAHGLATLERAYAEWPFFRALVDNAQVALVRADLDVAGVYAQLAGPEARGLYPLIAEEHRRTVGRILEVTGERALLSAMPAIAGTVERRNPYVDVLSHVQVELLRRLRAAPVEARGELRAALFITINGIAAGLQTAG